MHKHLKLTLNPPEAFDDEKRKNLLRQKLGLSDKDKLIEQPAKRSIDARGKQVKVHFETDVFVNEQARKVFEFDYQWQNVANAPEVLVVGCGPAGMFAALRLIELGLKPVVIERGKNVRDRRRDLAAINKEHVVNPDSNYCFGEGGAGTYSDGKLYTRSKKRGSVRRILEILHHHGAAYDILFDAHPHIGTNKLPKVVENLRETIINCGGEIRFNTRVEDIIVESNKLKGLKLQNGESMMNDHIILATGHSARNIYEMLYRHQIAIEAKPFAMGIRIEHPQQIIDQMQYHCDDRGLYLPAASYSVVSQTHFNKQQRGVFSFCMCPGGFIVPSATAPGEVVVNGMSPSKRNSKYANSGMVAAIELEDLADFAQHGPLAGLYLQMQLEQKAWQVGGQQQTAPAQRMVDFVEGKVSPSLNDCSYIPGLASVDLSEVLGKNLTARLREAFKAFGKKMKPYYTNEANLVGVESRSSSPVRIPRDAESLEHVALEGLFPCGEGAGYAGGIVSAAVDGERVAEAVFHKINR
ncbi:FAD-binding protein [bacterium]|nr:FAD-binding protein [bacterium]